MIIIRLYFNILFIDEQYYTIISQPRKSGQGVEGDGGSPRRCAATQSVPMSEFVSNRFHVTSRVPSASCCSLMTGMKYL